MSCLGIDTSCYTTSLALYDGSIKSDYREPLPVSGGERGLRQSEGFFLHIKRLETMIPAFLEKTGRNGITCVCVSARPRPGKDSYMPVFRAGKAAGAMLAGALNVPMYETSHQEGHLSAALIGNEELIGNKYLAMHLSGGTTDLLACEGGAITPLGGSIDIHAGQLVDRIGVALGLPFPSGKALEALARAFVGDSEAPPSFVDGFTCSFSGAETRLSNMIGQGAPKKEVAAAVYAVLVNTVDKLLSSAFEQTGVSNALLMGGVASSALFREMLTNRRTKRRREYDLNFGESALSGDNAVGVGRVGYLKSACTESIHNQGAFASCVFF